MISIDKDILKSIHALQREPNFIKVTQLLEDHLKNCIVGLMSASPNKVQPLQGRTKMVDELVTLFKHNQ